MSKIRLHAHTVVCESSVTPEDVYINRRRLMQAAIAGAAVSALPVMVQAGLQAGDDITPETIATSYNNFYEFGTGKSDPAANAHTLTTRPWSIEVAGETEQPGTFDLDDLLRGLQVEERIYRFRCVEAWSMVLPWQGVALSAFLNKLRPKSGARYVEFTTLYRPEEMPGQRSLFSGIDWPYVEGLRMDEAMHPLALMATGLYGKSLPNQNGAPLRLVVPWKYGFKNIKSIVKVRFTTRQPATTWAKLAPNEYGFYANVNPDVAHPRWSQARERRLPNSFLDQNWIPTLPFNGYADEVASLYTGMNLRRNF